MKYETDFQTGEYDDLPGQFAGVVVSHGVVMREPYRGLGYGKIENQRRLDFFTKQDYGYVLCTVAVDNLRQITILEGNGWRRIDTFRNVCYETNVHLYGKKLLEATK